MCTTVYNRWCGNAAMCTVELLVAKWSCTLHGCQSSLAYEPCMHHHMSVQWGLV